MTNRYIGGKRDEKLHQRYIVHLQRLDAYFEPRSEPGERGGTGTSEVTPVRASRFSEIAESDGSRLRASKVAGAVSYRL